MNSIFDILSGNTSINSILIYGSTDTLTCSSDGINRFFYKYLHDLLIAKGFQNVVFYDCSNANDKTIDWKKVESVK